MRKCLLVQPNNNIGIDEIAGGADSEGPGKGQNPEKTQPSGGENATLWFVIAAGRRDTMHARGCAVRRPGNSGNF